MRDKAATIPLEIGEAGGMDIERIEALKADLTRLRAQLDAAIDRR